MKYILLIIIVVSNIVIIGCTAKKKYSYEKIDYENFAKTIFSDYGYSLNYGIKKKYSDIVDIKISKKNLEDFEYQKNVKTKLIQQGWNYYSDVNKNHDIYCLNESTQLVLINKNINHGENSSLWHFIVYFDAYGIEECERIVADFKF